MECLDCRGPRVQLVSCFEKLRSYRGMIIAVETARAELCREEGHVTHLVGYRDKRVVTLKLRDLQLHLRPEERDLLTIEGDTHEGERCVLAILDEFFYNCGEQHWLFALPRITQVSFEEHTLITVAVEDVGRYQTRWHGETIDMICDRLNRHQGEGVDVLVEARKTTYEDDEGGYPFNLPPKNVTLVLERTSRLPEGLALLEGREMSRQQEVQIPFRGWANVIVTYGRYGFDLDSSITMITDARGQTLWRAGQVPVANVYLGFRDENLKHAPDHSAAGAQYDADPYLLIIRVKQRPI